MNLILLFEQDFIASQRVKLSDQRFRHIHTILQSRQGDQLRVGLLNGLIGTAVIDNISDEALEMTVELQQTAPAKLPLTVILALPRPKMVRRILRSIAELGVAELIVINSYKVEKSFWQSPVLEADKVRQYLIAGLQQAKDTHLPAVSFERRFKPFVEDTLPALLAGKQALIAHPGSGQPCPHQLNSPVILAIGPEGGFTDYEVAKFFEAGFDGVHLGNRILRVENAITAIISKLYQ